ncbi:MAG: hypothetical protein HC819_02770 [Cyclobacteriaceae bacterium]|nr:hypothetical protein [Cyclobacteriaceae bacterium]
MITHKILTLLSIAILVFSCSKDDEKPSIDETLLPGTWEILDLDYTGTTTTTAMGISVGSTFVGTIVENTVEINITSDPNEFTSSGSYTMDVKSTSMGQTVTTQIIVPYMIQDGNWTIEGDKFKVSDSGSAVEEATILQLDATTFILQIDSKTSAMVNGFSTVTDLHVKYTLGRI